MRIHLTFVFYVIIAGFVTHITKQEWAAILICIGTVTALECLNTAIESLCDTLHPGKCDGIGKAKDAAAGAVLLAAIASVFVGSDIFFRTDKFKFALEFFKNNTVLAVLIILAVVPLCFFIKGRKRD